MKAFLLNFLLLVITTWSTNAQSGTFDPSFGPNGQRNFGKAFVMTAFQSNGKLVGLEISNDTFVFYRITERGDLDPSFGQNGMSTIKSLLPANSQLSSLAVDNDGRIVLGAAVTTTSTVSSAIIRINSDGKIDSAFGVNGLSLHAIAPLTRSNGIADMVIQDDGRIIITYELAFPGGTSISFARFNSIGVFEVGGGIPGASGYNRYTAVDLKISKKGKIVIGEYGVNSFGITPSFMIARLNIDGSPDVSFGSNGLVVSNLSPSLVALAVDNNDKILASIGGNKLLRFNVNGSLDPTFDGNGIVTTALAITKILHQNDGRIIALGNLNGETAIARYSIDGSLDESFGNGGYLIKAAGVEFNATDIAIVGERLLVYGAGILSAYQLGTSTVQPIVTNTSNGNQALSSNTTGSENTALGGNALPVNTTGSGNTGLGYNSMYSNTTGVYNTAVGYAALALNVEGTSNVAVGLIAGYSNNNYSSTFLGTLTNSTVPVYNSTAVGFQAIVNESNQVRIGNSGVTSIGGFTSWTNLSDGRLKKNVNEDVPGLAFITKLRPVTYTLDIDGVDSKLKANLASRQGLSTRAKSILQPSADELKAKVAKAKVKYTGFVAQEVEQLAKKLNYEFSGVDVPTSKDGYYGLRYAEFVVPLVKAVQEQQRQIEEQQKENKNQQQQINEMKELVMKLSNAGTNNTTIGLSSASLEQSFPNPNNATTIVRYHLPPGTASAKIVISNMKGQLIKSIDLNSSGDGQLTLNTTALAAGTYTYSLVIGGKETDTKRMVITR